jgi:hypothetical protein
MVNLSIECCAVSKTYYTVSRHGYGKYVEKTLGLLSISRASLDIGKYGSWTSFEDGKGWH